MKYSPETVVWETTFKCNVNCIHCGSDCTSVEKDNQLTTAECIEIIEDLADIGAKTVILSGGEPLMREDIGVLASMIKRFGMEVAFISNGFRIDEDIAKMLHAIKPIAYGLSIDAADPYLHDYIRGRKHVFEHVENAIMLLHKYNVAPSVVTTVHKLNSGTF